MARSIVVVAIDFGTYASGIAYCKHATNGLAPDEIKYRTRWRDQRQPYPKTRTAILYQVEQPKSFGWSAEKEYMLLEESVRQRDRYTFVQNFKLALDEATKYRLPPGFNVVKVISDYLAFMRQSAYELFFDQQGEQLSNYTVSWVLTVPALWTEGQKALMRKAAFLAGIITQEQSEQLKIILEPEAASFYCLLNPNALRTNTRLEVGQTFMVIDAGGGTVDITMHTVQDNGYGKQVLSEATSGTAGFCGATYVDRNFEVYTRQQLGDATFNNWKSQNPEDYLQLMENWEREKHGFKAMRKAGGRPLYVKFPETLMDVLPPAVKENLRAKSDGYDDRLTLELSEMEGLFEPVVKQIVNLAVGMLRGSSVRCNRVLMVGGFAASPYLRSRLKAELSPLVDEVVEAEKPGDAVLLGAVQYGLQPDLIHSRRTRHAFGIETDDGTRKNAFLRLVPINHEVGVSHPITEDFVPTSDQHTTITFRLFRTHNNNARTTSEPGMELLANMVIKIPQQRLRNPDSYTLRVSLTFGATELRMTATDLQTDQTLVSEIQYSYSRVPEKQYLGAAQPPAQQQQVPQQQQQYMWQPVPQGVVAPQAYNVAQAQPAQAYNVAQAQPAGLGPFVQMGQPFGSVAAQPGVPMPSPFAAGGGALPLGMPQPSQAPMESPFTKGWLG